MQHFPVEYIFETVTSLISDSNTTHEQRQRLSTLVRELQVTSPPTRDQDAPPTSFLFSNYS
jgi:hypothetical protein